MEYKDYTDSNTGEKYINGYYVGVRNGTPMQDKLDTNRTGYEVQSLSVRHGSIMPDKLESINKLLLLKIEITTPATKLTYNIGEELDLAGLVVTGTYSGGSKKVLEVTKSNITGFNSSVATEKQTLTITVEGRTATFDIRITE